jgi:hypothetical protein
VPPAAVPLCENELDQKIAPGDTVFFFFRLDLNTRQIFWSTDGKKSWLRDYRDKPATPRYCPQCREAREGAGHRLVK